MLPFSFRPNGSGAITVIRGVGVASVARSAQGVFTAVLTDLWNQLDYCGGMVQLASGAARKLQGGAHVLASRQLVVRNVDAAGAAQDIASDANNWVHVMAILRLGSQD
jgi:hypothetical protein